MEQYNNLIKEDYNAIADPSWPSYEEFLTHRNVPECVYKEIDEMLNLTPFKHPSFCVLPFVGYEYPGNTFCCLVPVGSDRTKVKQEMLNSTRPNECIKCWDLEDCGIRSDRQIKNSSYDYYTGDLRAFYEDLQLGKEFPITLYKIDSSNLCNATCMICGAGASSAWISLHKKHNIYDYNHIKNDNDDIYVDYEHVKSISFRGGEPFLESKNFEILEKLINYGNTECVVSFVSNGSIWPTDKQLDLLRKFHNLIISFSIDGIGSVFDYLRYPLKWDIVVVNLNKWKSLGIAKLGVSYTVYNLNILYHKETTEWFRENDLQYFANVLYYAEHFRMSSLPKDVKEFIRNTHESTNSFSMFTTTHTTEDDINYQKFIDEIKHQDNYKGITINNYLPELVNLLGNPFKT